jgi:hypothetical protein
MTQPAVLVEDVLALGSGHIRRVPRIAVHENREPHAGRPGLGARGSVVICPAPDRSRTSKDRRPVVAAEKAGMPEPISTGAMCTSSSSSDYMDELREIHLGIPQPHRTGEPVSQQLARAYQEAARTAASIVPEARPSHTLGRARRA